MRVLAVVVTLLMFGSDALAQAPTLSAVVDPAAKRWATTDVDSTRFHDDEKTPGPTFQAGDELELIVEEGTRIRVRKGERYGWIPASAVTTVSPAPPAGLLAPPTLGAPGGLQLSPLGSAPPLLPGAGSGAVGGGAGAGN